MIHVYACPKCQSILSPGERIVLVGSSGGERVLVAFHPQPGNYEVWVPPGVELKQGALWSFFCPLCCTDLRSPDNDKLCALEVITNDRPRQALFSRIAGEQATFIVTPTAIEHRHGPDADLYVEQEMQLKYIRY
ncbi:MAG: hypothetical protein MUC50_11320 [Myxococcota bacterium]|jgi:hypothetical protein|nr:hypothetical protein [Myxococcota bacterium]